MNYESKTRRQTGVARLLCGLLVHILKKYFRQIHFQDIYFLLFKIAIHLFNIKLLKTLMLPSKTGQDQKQKRVNLNVLEPQELGASEFFLLYTTIVFSRTHLAPAVRTI